MACKKCADLTLQGVIYILESAPRKGALIDFPEGARNIVISDTLAIEMAAVIKRETADARILNEALKKDDSSA